MPESATTYTKPNVPRDMQTKGALYVQSNALMCPISVRGKNPSGQKSEYIEVSHTKSSTLKCFDSDLSPNHPVTGKQLKFSFERSVVTMWQENKMEISALYLQVKHRKILLERKSSIDGS